MQHFRANEKPLPVTKTTTLRMAVAGVVRKVRVLLKRATFFLFFWHVCHRFAVPRKVVGAPVSIRRSLDSTSTPLVWSAIAAPPPHRRGLGGPATDQHPCIRRFIKLVSAVFLATNPRRGYAFSQCFANSLMMVSVTTRLLPRLPLCTYAGCFTESWPEVSCKDYTNRTEKKVDPALVTAKGPI